MPVLIILAVLWAVVLVPPLLRSRNQHTADSIVDFNHKLDVLGRTNGTVDEADDVLAGGPMMTEPAPPMAGRPVLRAIPLGGSTAARRSAKRRREVLRAISMSIVCTLLLVSVAGSAATWALQILVDVLAGAYLGLWAWMRNAQAERIRKVRYMPELRVPELALRRSASS